MKHNATVTSPHTAIHPAAVHLSSSRLCHTDGPLLCHEMSSACACARVLYVLSTYVFCHARQWQVKVMTTCDIFRWCRIRYESPRDKLEWFHIPVCQSEGRSAVCLCQSLAMPLKDNKDNIDASASCRGFHFVFMQSA